MSFTGSTKVGKIVSATVGARLGMNSCSFGCDVFSFAQIFDLESVLVFLDAFRNDLVQEINACAGKCLLELGGNNAIIGASLVLPAMARRFQSMRSSS